LVFVSPIWQILKPSATTCLSIIFCFSLNITLILLCSKSNFELFKNSTKML
jgi:formate dehydrogenase assembly factor FdhD